MPVLTFALSVQIARRIKIVLRPGRSGGGKGDGEAVISVSLDMNVLNSLQLDLDALTVK